MNALAGPIGGERKRTRRGASIGCAWARGGHGRSGRASKHGLRTLRFGKRRSGLEGMLPVTQQPEQIANGTSGDHSSSAGGEQPDLAAPGQKPVQGLRRRA